MKSSDPNHPQNLLDKSFRYIYNYIYMHLKSSSYQKIPPSFFTSQASYEANFSPLKSFASRNGRLSWVRSPKALRQLFRVAKMQPPQVALSHCSPCCRRCRRSLGTHPARRLRWGLTPEKIGDKSEIV